MMTRKPQMYTEFLFFEKLLYKSSKLKAITKNAMNNIMSFFYLKHKLTKKPTSENSLAVRKIKI